MSGLTVSILVSSVIGSRKGSPIAGTVLGLILGPLGAIIVLLSGDKNRIACQYCAEKIQKVAKICPHCRKDIQPT